MPNWIDALPEEVKSTIAPEYVNNVNVNKFENMNEFIKSHVNAVEMVGKKGVILPTEKSTPEEVSAYKKAMGIPEKETEYEFSKLDKVHPKLSAEETAKTVRSIAAKYGLTKAQADGLYKDYLGMSTEALAKQEAGMVKATQDAEVALKNEWGAKYDENLKAASKVLKAVGGDALLTKANEKGWGRDPEFIKFAAKLGSTIGEDSMSKITGTTASNDSADAQNQINAIRADRTHPWQNEKHPDHKKWVTPNTGLMAELYKKAFPLEVAK